MRKILVVEDDPDIQEILKNHLTDAGYEVVLAEDGVAGISKFDDTIHLVLLDLMLPKIDGFGVCQVIRQRSQVPIVKDNAVAVLKATALPAYQAGRLFPLRRCHAVKGTVRPAFQRRQVFIGVISHAFPPSCFPLPFSPKRLPTPFLRRVPALARSPQLRDILSRSPAPCGASPAGVFLFARSFCFQGAVHR